MKSIICTECQAPIKFKNDLKVTGKLLQPYHTACLENPQSILGKMHKFSGCFPTGMKFWAWFTFGNLIFGYLIKSNAGETTALIVFAVVCNAVCILARVGIYYCYERHLG